MHWGRKVKAARVGRGMTQQQLADRVGKTQSEIARFERQNDLLVSTVATLAQGLDMSWADLAAVREAEDGGSA
jgi:transcriptional regulator with XRE-family HTH domain